MAEGQATWVMSATPDGTTSVDVVRKFDVVVTMAPASVLPDVVYPTPTHVGVLAEVHAT